MFGGLAGPQAQQARIESNEIQAQHYIEGLCGRGVGVMVCNYCTVQVEGYYGAVSQLQRAAQCNQRTPLFGLREYRVQGF